MRAVAVLIALGVLSLGGCLDEGGDGEADDPPAGSPAPVPGQADVLTGQLTAAEPDAVHVALLADGHAAVHFALVLATNLPETELVLNITAPDGRSAELDTAPTLYAFPGPAPATKFPPPTGGDWDLAVTLAGGASADYEVHWCTEGHRDPGNRACERYG